LTFQAQATDSILNLYMFGVAREMIVSIAATHAQPSLDVSKDSGPICHSGLPNFIGQAHLPFSFGLANATLVVHFHVLVAIPLRETIAKDLVHNLAYKML